MRTPISILMLVGLCGAVLVGCGPANDAEAPGAAVDAPVVEGGGAADQPVADAPADAADAFVVNDDPFVGIDAVGKALDAGMEIQFIDARPSLDYEFGHIPGAINVPYFDAESYDVSTLPTDRWLVAYCECPHQEALQVYEAFRALGVEKIKALDEGLAGWRDILGRDLEQSPASSEG